MFGSKSVPRWVCRVSPLFLGMGKKGLSLLEILVASILLALVLIGLANLFIVGKRYILHSRSRMTGGELGKFFLDPLQMDVRQDLWGTNCVSAGVGCDDTPQNIDGIDYTPIAYNVNPGAPIANLNRVTITLEWNENPP